MRPMLLFAALLLPLAGCSSAAVRRSTSRLYRLATEDLNPAARRLWALLREQTSRMPVAEQDDHRLTRVLAERRTRSQAFFSSSAGQWDRLRREMFGERSDLLALAALLDERWVVGDLGCGTGQIAEALAPFVARVIAVESSRAMLKSARQRLAHLESVELRQGELETLPVPDQALDAATMVLVLHHLPEPLLALLETSRTLKPGRRVLIVDMFEHDRREYQSQMGHVWLGFSRAQTEQLLADAGFVDVRVRALPGGWAVQTPSLT